MDESSSVCSKKAIISSFCLRIYINTCCGGFREFWRDAHMHRCSEEDWTDEEWEEQEEEEEEEW